MTGAGAWSVGSGGSKAGVFCSLRAIVLASLKRRQRGDEAVTFALLVADDRFPRWDLVAGRARLRLPGGGGGRGDGIRRRDNGAMVDVPRATRAFVHVDAVEVPGQIVPDQHRL